MTMTEIKQMGNNARQTAVKIYIKDLLSGMYIQEVDQNPNYLQTVDNKNIYRLNVIAIIIQKEILGTITNFLIDDSTGTIIARFFEENKHLNNFNIGDIVLITGKIRTYNQEKYISPEIIKKVNPLWLKIRLRELGERVTPEKIPIITMPKVNEEVKMQQAKISVAVQQNQVLEEEVMEDNVVLPYQKITQLIQTLDKGEGVRIEEIIEKSPLQNTEEIIEMMLKNGDIFQNSPGKVKVL